MRTMVDARALLLLPCLLLCLILAGCGGDGDNTGAGAPPSVATYALSGSVSHLDAGAVTLSDGNETLTVPQGATSFAFAKPLANGTAYTVTVATQPSGAACAVNNASGTVRGAAISNIAVVCNTLISQPLALSVGATGSLGSGVARIVLPVSQVGGVSTTINAILDTGSSGTLLRASDVFPASMVTASGFVFPAGQTSISYNGVTVTNIVASRMYGTESDQPTEQTGNLGFAQVSFGTGTRATTAVMPILFVWQLKASGTVVPTSNFANLIGVNASIEPVLVNGAAAGSTPNPCTSQSTTTCGLASPFRYLSYAAGVDKGFTLGKVTFATCDILTPGSCPLAPDLTIGVTADTAAEFSTTALSPCSSAVLFGTATEPLCSQVIPSVTVSSGGASFTGPAIFDSGAPTTRLSVPPGVAFPDSLPLGATVRIATASGFAYQFATGAGYATTTIAKPASGGDTNSGVGFFAQNSILVDYSKAVEGWRNGP